MTDAEADVAAARAVLAMLSSGSLADSDLSSQDQVAVLAGMARIERWLRRRAIGGDKILTRQMEQPVGRAVGMTPKQAKRFGIPEGGK